MAPYVTPLVNSLAKEMNKLSEETKIKDCCKVFILRIFSSQEDKTKFITALNQLVVDFS